MYFRHMPVVSQQLIKGSMYTTVKEGVAVVNAFVFSGLNVSVFSKVFNSQQCTEPICTFFIFYLSE